MDGFLLLLIYFLPTLIAALRLRLWFDVFICNYLLGWTVIGWFIALHLACRPREVERIN